ncbi:MAG: hypothetical protein IKO22_07590 [Oscillospiraceae bacterium]|nr:hypothetical protein [Oscillospiraceae bacterium]
MEIVTRAAACAVVGSLLALLLRKYTPELSLLAALVTGGAVVWLCAGVCGRIVETLGTIAERSGVEAVYLSPVLKCVAIGAVTRMASQLCRDAQQGSVGAAVELCGAACALYVSLPLVESLLSVVERLL